MPNPPLLSDQPEVMTIPEAAAALRLTPRTIRKAITLGELRATIIGGRDPLHSGRGLGYRIRREDLQAWYFGESAVQR
jgi:excisionase family DNA binding protein